MNKVAAIEKTVIVTALSVSVFIVLFFKVKSLFKTCLGLF